MADPIQLVRSRDALKRVRGGRDGLYPILEQNTWDVVHWFDDFLGDLVKGDATAPGIYEIVTGVDGDALILANQPNGIVEIRATASGVGAGNEYCGFALPELPFTGDRNAVIAVRLNIDAITNVKVEIGFTDVTTDEGAVNVLATPTFTATDAAMWVFDTTDTAFWQAVGVKAGAAATKIEPGIAPVAGTFETMIVALRDDNAKFIRLDANGHQTYESAWMTVAITETVQLVPWIFVQERTGTDRGVRVDFLDVRARRTIN